MKNYSYGFKPKSHFIHLKLTQYCLSTMFQYKIKIKKIKQRAILDFFFFGLGLYFTMTGITPCFNDYFHD